MKKIIYIFIFIHLTSCSIDSGSGIWNNEKKNLYTEKLNKTINLDDDFTYEEIKKKIIKYGKYSNYPSLSNKK